MDEFINALSMKPHYTFDSAGKIFDARSKMGEFYIDNETERWKKTGLRL